MEQNRQTSGSEDSLVGLLNDNPKLILDSMDPSKRYSFFPSKTRSLIIKILREQQKEKDGISTKSGVFKIDDIPMTEEPLVTLMYQNPGKFATVIKTFTEDMHNHILGLEKMPKIDMKEYIGYVLPTYDFFSKLSELKVDKKMLFRGPLDPDENQIRVMIREALAVSAQYNQTAIEKLDLKDEMKYDFLLNYSPKALYNMLDNLSGKLHEIGKKSEDSVLNAKGLRFLITNERSLNELLSRPNLGPLGDHIRNLSKNCVDKIQKLLAPPQGYNSNGFKLSSLEEALNTQGFFYNGIVPRTSATMFYSEILYKILGRVLRNKENPRDYVPLVHMNMHDVPGYDFFDAAIGFLEKKIEGGKNENEPRF